MPGPGRGLGACTLPSVTVKTSARVVRHVTLLSSAAVLRRRSNPTLVRDCSFQGQRLGLRAHCDLAPQVLRRLQAGCLERVQSASLLKSNNGTLRCRPRGKAHLSGKTLQEAATGLGWMRVKGSLCSAASLEELQLSDRVGAHDGSYKHGQSRNILVCSNKGNVQTKEQTPATAILSKGLEKSCYFGEAAAHPR